MINKYIEFLAQEASRNKLVIFVGAGISMNSGLPSWSKLISNFTKSLDSTEKDFYTEEETLLIPQVFFDKFGKIKYYEILNQVFNSKKMIPNSIHDKLEKLDINYIITTNYDTLIEDKLNDSTQSYEVISTEEDLAHTQGNKMIIKMHGQLSEKNIVLKKSDYDNYEDEHPLISTYIKSLFTTNTILFIGYSLNDLNVKLMMKWIQEILKDDFRKVYLADVENPTPLSIYNSNNNRMINRLFLQDLDIFKQNSEITREEMLTNFLEKIISEKDSIELKISGKFYLTLPYINNNNLKKILSTDYISSYSFDNYQLIKTLNVTDDRNIDEIKKLDYNLLLKANIIKINKTDISKFFNIKDFNTDNFLKKQANIISKVFTFNFSDDDFNDNDFDNKFILSYYYFSKMEFNKAEQILTQLKDSTYEPEVILWCIFNINNVNKLIQHLNSEIEIKFFNVKKEYFKYFQNIYTDTYKEIIENHSLVSYEKDFIDILSKLRKSKNSTTISGYSPLEEAINKIIDLLYFTIQNGHLGSFSKSLKNCYLFYIEIIFIAYNNISNEYSPFKSVPSKRNFLEEFDYFDIYIMLNLDYKDFKMLIEQYKIETLKLSIENTNTVMTAFENYINHFHDTLSRNSFYGISKFDNFLLILSKIKLSEENVSKVLSFISSQIIIQQFSSEAHYLFREFINKNKDSISDDFIEKLLNLYLEIRNPNFEIINIKERIFSYFTSLFCNKTDRKIQLDLEGLYPKETKVDITNLFITNDIKTSDNIKSLKILLYFSQIVTDDIKVKISNFSKEYLEKIFSIELYYLMLQYSLIEPTDKFENNILCKLSTISNSKEITMGEHDLFIGTTINILLGDFYTDDLKSKLIVLSEKEEFVGFLKSKKIESIFKYTLNKNEFDFNLFTISDLERFSKKALNDIIKQDSNNIVKEKLKEFLKDKYNDMFIEVLLSKND